LTVEAEETEMSNPHDDPGRRPPPPRQGEPPSSYQGGPPPHQADPSLHQGPPPYQQPGAHWQAPPPPGARPPFPDARPERGGSLLGSLFDFSFDRMVTPQMIKGAYGFAVLFTTMTALVWIIIGFWLFQYGYLLTVFIVLFTPPLWLLSMIASRMFLEFLINQFKITEHLKAMREREGLR
jgi:Domain of unknown function (DUF4282)